jgi:AAA-like domain
MSKNQVQEGFRRIESSEQKYKILKRILLSSKTKEISVDLNIKEGTVRHHASEIYEYFQLEIPAEGNRKSKDARRELTDLIAEHEPGKILELAREFGWDRINSQLKNKLVARLSPTKGALLENSLVYIERDEDQQLQASLSLPSRSQDYSLYVIKGSEGVGKSSLLSRIYNWLESERFPNQADASSSIVKLINLNTNENLTSPNSLADLHEFLLNFTKIISEEFRPDYKGADLPSVEKYWIKSKDGGDAAGTICTRYLREYIFNNIDRSCYLLIDGLVDVVLGTNVEEGFQNVIRSWYQGNGLQGFTQKPTMILTYSRLLTFSLGITSPLDTVGKHFVLNDFNKEQVKNLSKRYALCLRESDLDEIINLLGGKPELINTAFYYMMKNSREDVSNLIETAYRLDGPFAEYLVHLSNIRRFIELFRRVLEKDVNLSVQEKFALSKAGFIKVNQDFAQIPSPSCQLFERYYIQTHM